MSVLRRLPHHVEDLFDKRKRHIFVKQIGHTVYKDQPPHFPRRWSLQRRSIQCDPSIPFSPGRRKFGWSSIFFLTHCLQSRCKAHRVQFVQPGESTVQPATGFQVNSVHSIADFAVLFFSPFRECNLHTIRKSIFRSFRRWRLSFRSFLCSLTTQARSCSSWKDKGVWSFWCLSKISFIVRVCPSNSSRSIFSKSSMDETAQRVQAWIHQLRSK